MLFLNLSYSTNYLTRCTCFESIEGMSTAATIMELRKLTKDNFRNCFKNDRTNVGDKWGNEMREIVLGVTAGSVFLTIIHRTF